MFDLLSLYIDRFIAQTSYNSRGNIFIIYFFIADFARVIPDQSLPGMRGEIEQQLLVFS